MICNSLKRISIIIIILSLLFASSFACFSKPLHESNGLTSENGVWLIQTLTYDNPYYSKEITLFCIPDSVYYHGSNVSSKELCNDGSFNQNIIKTIQIDGKNTEFYFTNIDKYDAPYKLSSYSEDIKTINAIKIKDNKFYNGFTNKLTINEHNFNFKYSRATRPMWSLAIISAILGFISLFIQNIKIKRIVLILSIIFTILSFTILRFDSIGKCGGCESPGFISIGIFLIVFYLILSYNNLKIIKNIEYKNTKLKILYMIIFVIFIFINWAISKECWIS